MRPGLRRFGEKAALVAGAMGLLGGAAEVANHSIDTEIHEKAKETLLKNRMDADPTTIQKEAESRAKQTAKDQRNAQKKEDGRKGILRVFNEERNTDLVDRLKNEQLMLDRILQEWENDKKEGNFSPEYKLWRKKVGELMQSLEQVNSDALFGVYDHESFSINVPGGLGVAEEIDNKFDERAAEDADKEYASGVRVKKFGEGADLDSFRNSKLKDLSERIRKVTINFNKKLSDVLGEYQDDWDPTPLYWLSAELKIEAGRLQNIDRLKLNPTSVYLKDEIPPNPWIDKRLRNGDTSHIGVTADPGDYQYSKTARAVSAQGAKVFELIAGGLIKIDQKLSGQKSRGVNMDKSNNLTIPGSSPYEQLLRGDESDPLYAKYLAQYRKALENFRNLSAAQLEKKLADPNLQYTRQCALEWLLAKAKAEK